MSIMTTPIGDSSRIKIDDLQAILSSITKFTDVCINHLLPKDAVDSLVLAVFEAARCQDSSEGEKVLHVNILKIDDVC